MKALPPKINRTPHDVYGERYRAVKSQLSPRLYAVARYIYENRSSVLAMTAINIAAETGSSDATVIRTIQALGFSGLRELKTVLAAYLGITPRSPRRVASTVNGLAVNSGSGIDFVIESYRMSCDMLAGAENRRAIAAAVTLMQSADRVAVFGIGASAILADYAARLFNRNGMSAYVLNRTGISLSEQLLEMRKGDVVIMLAQRSAHPEGLTTVAEAKKLGIPLILLTGSKETAFAKYAQQIIEIPRSISSDKMPVHATPMICLEILILELASRSPVATLSSANRLYELSNALSQPRKK